MTNCSGCNRPVVPSDTQPALRSGPEEYHLSCAPEAMLEAAAEEYRAIVRKGVRYFVEKYSVGAVEAPEVGRRFSELGQAIEAESGRRARG
jgi:hypothetical protein